MKSIILTFIISAFVFSLIRYFFKGNEKRMIRPHQIKINELSVTMDRLLENKLDFDFFGITSNGIDCIYFMFEDSVINIDFEVMRIEQREYVEDYIIFAKENDFEVKVTSYDNQFNNSSLEKAKVYKMILNADKSKAEQIGADIQKVVFKNDSSTDFEIVP